MARRHRFSFGGDENILKLTVDFKWAKRVACELHLNEAVLKYP